MNKAELVNAMAKSAGLTKKDSEGALNALLSAVQDTLAANEKVTLVGFGSFETRARAARKGVNPRTKQVIDIPATTAPVFKAGKGFKEHIQATGKKAPAKKKK